jgi:sarcosine oxidase
MDAAGVPYEHLDAAEIRRRWPQFAVTDEIHGLYQPESGIAMAARGNAAHLRLARGYGATLRDQAPVERLRPVGGELEVAAGGVIYRCRRLVIAGGAWSNGALTHFGMRLPLRVTKEQVTYFATPHQAEFQPDRFPIWIWMDDPCFYGFPVFGEAGPKAGQDAGGQEVTAETRTFDPDQAALERTVGFLRKYIPKALGPIIYTKTCLYTLTPDRDFVLDRLPGHPGVVVGIGGGHGYKFASVIGRILSELAIDGRTEHDLEPFRIDRAILQLENPPVNYMV